MLLCLHEESAVAIAHGYAKVTGRAMAAALHSNVGLMHATMAIFNAWCDRMPVLLLGATGPVDAAKRRPWIDWIHTARDQGALVRGYTKWDDQPASPGGGARSAAARRVDRQHRAEGAGLRQPRRRDAGGEARRAVRRRSTSRASCRRSRARRAAEHVAKAAALLKAAKNIVILAGRVSRSEDAWNARVALAEAHRRARAHRPQDRRELPDRSSAACRRAGACLRRMPKALAALGAGRRDPQPRLGRSRRHAEGREGAGRERQGHPGLGRPSAPQRLEHGPSGPAAGRCAARRPIPTRACRCCSTRSAPRRSAPCRGAAPRRIRSSAGGPLTVEHLARRAARRGRRHAMLAHASAAVLERRLLAVPPSARLSRLRRRRRRRRRARHLGRRGARAEGHRPPAVAICGDGDFLMGVTALWTAAHYRIPLLIVVANNRSFFNDELHQERVARMRNRPVENRWIGQRISDPDIDLAAMARAQGAHGFGPVDERRRARRDFRRGDRRGRTRRGRGRRCAGRAGLCAGHDGGRARTRRGKTDGDRDAPRIRPRARAAAEPHPRRRRHRQALRDAGRRRHRRRRHLVRRAAGRIPRGDRPVRLRQVDAVQHHRRAARRLRRQRHGRGRDASPARTRRSAWCSRRNRPSPGAP